MYGCHNNGINLFLYAVKRRGRFPAFFLDCYWLGVYDADASELGKLVTVKVMLRSSIEEYPQVHGHKPVGLSPKKLLRMS